MPDPYNVTISLKAGGSIPGRTPATATGGLFSSPNMVPANQQFLQRKPGAGFFSGGWPIPRFNDAMTFSDVGVTGLRQFGGWVREEWIPDLIGRQGARTYREMLDNSAIVGAVMFAINASMRKVDWRVEAAADTPAAAELEEFVESLMDDMSHTWGDFIAESLSMLGYGYAPHEIVYKKRLGRDPGADPQNPGQNLPSSKFDDGMIGWRRIPLRGQDTVIKWFFGQNGEILGLTQQPWFGPLIDIPIEKMLLFRPTIHKGNPEGRSILRTAYRSWFLGKRMEEQEAILFERLSGLPVIRVPNVVLEMANAGNPAAAATVAQYQKIARNLRIDEQMGVVFPSDMYPTSTGGLSDKRMYDIELITPQAGRSNVDSDKSISRYNINIMTSMMSDFLQLGHEARGTQSLAVSKVDMFFQAIEGFLNSDADVINRRGLDRICKLNALDPDIMPEIKPDLAQRVDLDVLSNYILRLSQSGMPLFPDPDLENWARDAAGMPDVTEEGAYSVTGIDKPTASQATTPTPAQQSQQDQNRSNLEKVVRASIMRRLVKFNGATGETAGYRADRAKRKRELKRRLASERAA